MSAKIGNTYATKPVKTTTMSFRLPEALATQARGKAKAQNLKISHFLAKLVQRECESDARTP